MSTIVDPYAARLEKDPRFSEILGLGDDALLNRFARGVENFDRRVFNLNDDQLDLAFLPDAGVGQWPVRVLLGHLADAEVLYVHRIRRAVSEENPVLSVWDENAPIDAGMYNGPAHPVGAFVAVVHTLRRWHAEWMTTLLPDQWDRQALNPQRGPMSVRTMMRYDTWHLEHHADYLNRKLTRLLGAAKPAGGCGPNCGCKGQA
jgi:hypothetical protein